jgi:hypothetical protein
MYSRHDLDAVAIKAAEEGARRVMRDLGIPADEAGLHSFRNDMTEVRGLIEAYRTARHTIWVTAVKWGTALFLGVLMAAFGWGLHDKIR